MVQFGSEGRWKNNFVRKNPHRAPQMINGRPLTNLSTQACDHMNVKKGIQLLLLLAIRRHTTESVLLFSHKFHLCDFGLVPVE